MPNNSHIVIDIGGSRSKIGFSGNNSPSAVIATPADIYQNKLFKNFISLENHLSQVFTNELNINPVDMSCVLLESMIENQQNRAKLYEIMFETFCFGKVAMVGDAPMSLYSYISDRTKGKPALMDITGLVVDIGSLQSIITPIMEGYVIQKGIMSFSINGNVIREEIEKSLFTHNYDKVKDFERVEIDELISYIYKKLIKTSLNVNKPRIGTKTVSLVLGKKVS